MLRKPHARAQRRLTLCALLVVLLSLAAIGPHASAQRRGAGAAAHGRKLVVDSRDSVTIAELAQVGATRLADYGSFQLWRASEEHSRRLQSRPSVTARDMMDTIALRRGPLDTRRGPPPVPADLRQTRGAGPQLWMVQFVGPIKDAWLAQLREAGIELVSFVASNSYVVWGEQAELARLDALAASSPSIQWTGAYHPAYRLAPQLERAARGPGAGERLGVTVQLYTSALTPGSLQRLRAQGGRIHAGPWQILGFTTISLELPAARLIAIANWPDVYNIEPWATPTQLDEVQSQIIAGNVVSSGGRVVPERPGYLDWLASKGFPTDPAQYPIVDVVDDGIDQGNADEVLHPDFHELGDAALPDRIEYIHNCTGDTSGDGVGGHGNLNAGIVASYNQRSGSPHQDAAGYRRGLGVSPYGRVAGTKIFRNSGTFDLSKCEDSYSVLVANAYQAGARITNNSWGYADYSNYYDSYAQTYDALTRDAVRSSPGNQQMLHIFAAGNDGPSSHTVDTPALAKNVLAVGATESVRGDGASCGTTESDSADDLVSWSSRGPTPDGRVKPDLVAPGAHIQGPASQDPEYAPGGDPRVVCDWYYPSGQTLYTWSSGTSHAAPAVAGAASLLYEYYGRALRPGQTPSPAMLKALLLNAGRHLNGVDTGDALPSPNQGWGGLDLGRLFNGVPRTLVDQSHVFSVSGETYTVGSRAYEAEPLRITLVWTDAPGTANSGAAYVNDLDLEVTVGDAVYKGNAFSGVYSDSATTRKFDPRNNVESVFLPPGAAGEISLRVIARNIAGDGVPGNGDTTDQDFALVVSSAWRGYLPLIDR